MTITEIVLSNASYIVLLVLVIIHKIRLDRYKQMISSLTDSVNALIEHGKESNKICALLAEREEANSKENRLLQQS